MMMKRTPSPVNVAEHDLLVKGLTGPTIISRESEQECPIAKGCASVD